jgi:hypothetical protein
MDSSTRRWSPERVIVVAAVAFGVAAGSYGIANAANGSGSGPGSGSSRTPAASAPHAGQPWGGQRSDETPLPVMR